MDIITLSLAKKYTNNGISTLDTEKANKAPNPIAGHIATLDTNGNPIDSAKSISDLATAEQGGIVDLLTTYVEVVDVSNVYACNLLSAIVKSFYLVIANSTSKTITFSNVPSGRCEVFLEITASATAPVIWTLNGGSVSWSLSIAPVLTSGYVYRIMLITNDSGATWDGYLAGGVA